MVLDTWDQQEEKPLWLCLLAAHYQLSSPLTPVYHAYGVSGDHNLTYSLLLAGSFENKNVSAGLK